MLISGERFCIRYVCVYTGKYTPLNNGHTQDPVFCPCGKAQEKAASLSLHNNLGEGGKTEMPGQNRQGETNLVAIILLI